LDKQDHSQASDEPEAAAGELARRCTLCRTTIAGDFYLLRGLVVCHECAHKIEQTQVGPKRLRGALLFGAAAAVVAAVLWFLATAATGRPLSGIAILAGIVIGLAVHQGSRGRGGLRYQLAAALLVYAAFVVRYVPPVFGGIAGAIKRDHAAAQLAEGKAKPGTPRAAAAPSASTAPGAAAAAVPAPGTQTSALATLKAYFVFTAIAWGLVLASPFMPSTSGVLPVLWLAVGMALAFRLNRRPRLRGPFSESDGS
jgi:hypothetical protein